MLEGLKAAINKKKQEAQTQVQVKSSERHEQSKGVKKQTQSDFDDDEKRAREALERKAQRYQQLARSETDVVPAGSLVDFEEKFSKRMRYVDKQDAKSKSEDDEKSRSLAAIAPPQTLLQSTKSQSQSIRVREAVEDILASTFSEAASE